MQLEPPFPSHSTQKLPSVWFSWGRGPLRKPSGEHMLLSRESYVVFIKWRGCRACDVMRFGMPVLLEMHEIGVWQVWG